MCPSLRALVLPLLLPAALTAQTVAGSFAPNPAPIGQPITFTGTDATGAGFSIGTPCIWLRIHDGTPDGPLLQLNVGCGQIVVPVGPHGSHQVTWDQTKLVGNQLVQAPPGRYWFEAQVFVGSTVTTDWFCATIQDPLNPSEPALSAPSAPRVGQPAPLALAAPADAGATYVALAALSSNRPFDVGPLSFCLSSDPLLRASLRANATVFANGVGSLDGTGQASGLALLVPNDPQVAFRGLHVQALVLGSGGPRLSNDLALTALP